MAASTASDRPAAPIRSNKGRQVSIQLMLSQPETTGDLILCLSAGQHLQRGTLEWRDT